MEHKGIYGIGVDLCQTARMEKSLEKEAFLRHTFAPAEWALLQSHRGKARVETAAANFAAKEAFLKAAGTGLGGFALADIAALRDAAGAPYYALTGTAAQWLAQNRLCAHLSLTHEAGLACAFAVLEWAEDAEKGGECHAGAD